MGKSLLFQCLSNTNAMQHKRRLLLYICLLYTSHPLSGLLFCKDCGAKMHIRIDYRNGGKRHVAYCSEYHKGKAKNPKCHSPHIIDADLLMPVSYTHLGLCMVQGHIRFWEQGLEILPIFRAHRNPRAACDAAVLGQFLQNPVKAFQDTCLLYTSHISFHPRPSYGRTG